MQGDENDAVRQGLQALPWNRKWDCRVGRQLREIFVTAQIPN